MVIAKNVKEAVNGEVSHFAFRAVSEFFGLLDGTIQIDDNVSQLCFFLGDVLLPFIQCKGEDIGRCIDIAVVCVYRSSSTAPSYRTGSSDERNHS